MRKNLVMLGIVIATLVPVGGGCLEVRGGLARDGETQADTAGGEGVATPDADLCAGKSCDDGNPCTEDRCNASTGQCDHVGAAAGAAVPAEPYECTNAGDCEDGNACTIDACSIAQCRAGGWCTHTSNPDCQVGCANGCDDGNPCTDDACVRDACEHATLAECDPQCTSAGLLPVHKAWLLPSGTFVKALGTVQMSRANVACNDHEVCGCWGTPSLVGYLSELALYAAVQDEPAMSCRSRDARLDTPFSVDCEPMAAGVDHRVWGTGVDSDSIPSGAAPEGEMPQPPPQVEAIAVQGFCLDTSVLALIGRYQMFFERWGATAELKAEFVFDEPGWLSIHVQGALCENCQPIDTWSVLEVLDNGVRFKFDALFDDHGTAVVVRLASVGNALTGRWMVEDYAVGPIFTLHGPAAGDSAGAGPGSASTPARADGDGVVDPYYAGGSLRLVRLPGDAPRSPCEWTP